VDITPSGRRFLGQLGNDTVRLTLNCLPSHTAATVDFDLFIIRSWDGNIVLQPDTGYGVGPDIWGLSVAGGPTLLHTTFTNYTVWPGFEFRQAYPGAYPGGDYAPRTGAKENDSLGYSFENYAHMDSVYHLTLTFSHTASALQFDFSAAGLQPLLDESWGLDNVDVTLAP
jgi:hypothetical protein